MASSSGSRRFDVFPSFSGKDVRKTFLGYLLMALERRSINSFIDNEIERSRPIGPELIAAIREARISIVIFSNNYASSSWCLNELVEIHKCHKELDQMVIPVFYYVDPSDVRKQTGEFGKFFEETCKGKHEDHIQSWKQALTDVANMAGEDLRNWPSEPHIVEKIANDVSNKLLSPSNGFDDFTGIEAHIEAMNSLLCLESEEVRMVGIWGQSGIGKSTLGRALFSHLSPKFPFRNFITDKPMDKDVSCMKLKWEKEFLSKILDQKDLKIETFGEVKKRLNSKKVLIVLDDVVNPEFLKTLVGKNEWFGSGSRVIVITQDSHLLKAHKIDLLYEVKIPDQDLALKMLCQCAFGENSPPEGFKELAVEVAKVVGNLPLGLSVLGLSLKGRTTDEWKELLPGLEKDLKDDIMKTLRVGYDRLDEKEKEIFLWIALVFNGKSVKSINDFFGDSKGGLKRLAEKSLVRITLTKISDSRGRIRANEEIVEMHDLLEKLGREIVRSKSKGNPPGEHRFLTDAEEIVEVFTNQTGTETVLGIHLGNASINEETINEKSLERMCSLQFLEINNSDLNRSLLPNGLVYLRKLKYLEWPSYPLKCLPSNFRTECLVEFRMEYSNLEKLWEGTQQLGSLKTIRMKSSYHLKEIPDLSKAINLERVDFSFCFELESFQSHLTWKSLEYLNLIGCRSLKNFPNIEMISLPHGIEITVDDSFWNKNLHGHDYLDCLRRCFPTKFLPEHIVRLQVQDSTMKKLCDGVQSLGSLREMNLSSSENLKRIPDLSKAANLKYLDLSNCKRLVALPFTIGNLKRLEKLEMEKCRGLKVLPVNVNLSSLRTLNLSHCSRLKSFPRISSSIQNLYLQYTSIEEVPCCILMFQRLTILSMSGCKKLKNISPNIFRLKNLKKVDFTDCGDCVITALSDSTVVETTEDPYETIEKGHKVENDPWYFSFQNCLKLDRGARELIMQSSFKCTTVLPGGEVPTYFKHRAFGNSLTFTLPQSSLSHQFLRFNVCVVVDPRATMLYNLYLHLRFDGVFYKYVAYVGFSGMWKTDHLVLCSFKFQPTSITSKLDSKDVEFKFVDSRRIKEFGIRLLNVSPSPDDRDGRNSETDVVETERGNTQMQMTSSEQRVMDTGLMAPNLWIDSMLTEQQDAQLTTVNPDPDPEPVYTWPSSCSISTASSGRASIFFCWGGLLKNKKKEFR